MLNTLPTRLTACVLSGAALALLLIVGASDLSLQNTGQSLSADRMRVVAVSIKAALEQRVDLGVPLNFLEDAQRIVEREKALTAGVGRIDIFGERLVTLYSSERLTIGEGVDPRWLTPDGRLRAEPWTLSSAESIVVGVPLMNSFNRPIGGVVLVVPTSGLADVTSGLMWAVALPGLAFLGLAWLLVAVGARLFLQEPSQEMEAAIRRLERAKSLTEPGPVIDPATEPPNVLAASVFLEDILLKAAEADRQIRTIDETS